MKQKTKKYILAIFAWITLLMVLENPAFTALNVSYTTNQVQEQAPTSLGGISLEGSSIISYSTTIVSATNSTGDIINAYQIDVTVINLSAVFILILPLIALALNEVMRKETRKEPKKE